MKIDISYGLLALLTCLPYCYQQQQSASNQFFPGPAQQSSGFTGPSGGPQFGPQQGPMGGPNQGGPIIRQPMLAGAPQVKIVLDLFPFDRATHVPQVFWTEPTSQPVYCVSQVPTVELRFACPTCSAVNFTSPRNFGGQQPPSLLLLDQLLIQNTVDVSTQVGHPAIKLVSMQVNGELWDRQRLQCTAFYSGTLQSANLAPFERPNVTTETTVSVAYISKPQILDQFDHRPIFQATPSGQLDLSGSGRFYVPQAASLSLKCFVRGNPPPTMFQWRMGSQVLTTSPQIQIPGQQLQGAASFSCRVAQVPINTGQQQPLGSADWKTSDDVIVEPLVGPAVAETNFESVSRSNVKDTVTGKVPVERASPVTLQCTAGSSSKPFVVWLHQPTPGRIFNASCENGPRTVSENTLPNPKGIANVISVTSSCNLVLNAFEKAGDYWCSACSYVAENFTLCHPATNVAPANSASFDLSGAPMISPSFRVEIAPATEKTNLIFTYCADPMPSAGDIYFLVDGERLNLNSQLSGRGIQASGPRQNETYPRCQNVLLLFGSTIDLARISTLYMHIALQDGRKVQQGFNVQEIVKDISREAFHTTAYDATALGVGIAIGLVVFVAVITTLYFWYKKLCCFQPGKAANGKTTKIGGASSKPGKYSPGSQLRPDVQQDKPINRTTNGLSERVNTGPTNGYNSPTTKKVPHEGLTYSEFDLVKDSSRLVPQFPHGHGSRTVEYARMNPNSVKSPTNSIV